MLTMSAKDHSRSSDGRGSARAARRRCSRTSGPCRARTPTAVAGSRSNDMYSGCARRSAAVRAGSGRRSCAPGGRRRRRSPCGPAPSFIAPASGSTASSGRSTTPSGTAVVVRRRRAARGAAASSGPGDVVPEHARAVALDQLAELRGRVRGVVAARDGGDEVRHRAERRGRRRSSRGHPSSRRRSAGPRRAPLRPARRRRHAGAVEAGHGAGSATADGQRQYPSWCLVTSTT